jgi:hypothetical protein
MMLDKITLTRNQIERIITLIGIDTRVKSVTIQEHHNSGIGVGHTGYFNYNLPDDDQGFQTDLTDTSTW